MPDILISVARMSCKSRYQEFKAQGLKLGAIIEALIFEFHFSAHQIADAVRGRI